MSPRHPEQVRPAQVRSAQVSPEQLSPAQVSPAQIGPMEVAITQGGSAQVGPAQIQPYIWIVLSPFAYRLCPLLYDLDVFRIGYDVFLGSDRVPI